MNQFLSWFFQKISVVFFAVLSSIGLLDNRNIALNQEISSQQEIQIAKELESNEKKINTDDNSEDILQPAAENKNGGESEIKKVESEPIENINYKSNNEIKPNANKKEFINIPTDEIVSAAKKLLENKELGQNTSLLDVNAVNLSSRNALVNIFCVSSNDNVINSISGSGAIINEKGVIITNAHIGQYFLFKDFPTKDFMDCFIRTGNPAKNAYKAELLYLPPLWISDNKTNLITNNPKSSGEKDYALLRISSHANPSNILPEKFAYILPDISYDPIVGQEILTVSYPAGFLAGISIIKDLYAVSSLSSVSEIYSFDTINKDFITTTGSITAQKGSSGGGVISLSNGEIIALISTVSDAEMTSQRILGSITIPYVNRDMTENYIFNLASLDTLDLVLYSEYFKKNIQPLLEKILNEALFQRN